MTRLRYRLAYWLDRLYALLGVCRRCQSDLNRLRNGTKVCPVCSRRY